MMHAGITNHSERRRSDSDACPKVRRFLRGIVSPTCQKLSYFRPTRHRAASVLAVADPGYVCREDHSFNVIRQLSSESVDPMEHSAAVVNDAQGENANCGTITEFVQRWTPLGAQLSSIPDSTGNGEPSLHGPSRRNSQPRPTSCDAHPSASGCNISKSGNATSARRTSVLRHGKAMGRHPLPPLPPDSNLCVGRDANTTKVDYLGDDVASNAVAPSKPTRCAKPRVSLRCSPLPAQRSQQNSEGVNDEDCAVISAKSLGHIGTQRDILHANEFGATRSEPITSASFARKQSVAVALPNELRVDSEGHSSIEVSPIRSLSSRSGRIFTSTDSDASVSSPKALSRWAGLGFTREELEEMWEEAAVTCDTEDATGLSPLSLTPRNEAREKQLIEHIVKMDRHARLVDVHSRLGPDLGFKGAKQNGLGPHLWGISLEQLADVRSDRRYVGSKKDLYGCLTGGMTMRDVVEKIIKPLTAGKGMGYALMRNKVRPLSARIMVSHSWDEAYDDFLTALQSSGETGPFWVCSMAMYQCEDISALTIREQLGEDPAWGPFATVMRQADVMVVLVTLRCNVYTRMWCVYEMFMALRLDVPVNMAQTTVFSDNHGYIDAFLKQCEVPVCSRDARCGDPNQLMNYDEKVIRMRIESSLGGYDAVDIGVEMARLQALERVQKEILPQLNRSDIRSEKHADNLQAKYVGLTELVRARLETARHAASIAAQLTDVLERSSSTDIAANQGNVHEATLRALWKISCYEEGRAAKGNNSNVLRRVVRIALENLRSSHARSATTVSVDAVAFAVLPPQVRASDAVVLEDSRWEIRAEMARVLGEIGEVAADYVPALTQAMEEDCNSEVQAAAAAALRKISQAWHSEAHAADLERGDMK